MSDINNLGDEMQQYVKYLPIGLFCLIIGKLLITGANWESAVLATVTGALAAAYEYKNHSKQVKALEDRIELVVDTVNNQAKVIEEFRLSLSSVRLTQQAKTISTQPAKTEIQRIF